MRMEFLDLIAVRFHRGGVMTENELLKYVVSYALPILAFFISLASFRVAKRSARVGETFETEKKLTELLKNFLALSFKYQKVVSNYNDAKSILMACSQNEKCIKCEKRSNCYDRLLEDLSASNVMMQEASEFYDESIKALKGLRVKKPNPSLFEAAIRGLVVLEASIDSLGEGVASLLKDSRDLEVSFLEELREAEDVAESEKSVTN